MRIVHCFRSPVGGIFRHVRDLAKAQSEAGHLVGIICDSSTGGAHEELLFEQTLPYLALGVRRTAMQRHIGPGDIASAWRTHRIIKELQPDILHGHGAKGGVYSRLFGSMLRVSGWPVARLYSLHGGSLHYDEASASGRVLFLLERVMERFTDHLLFVSDFERATYRQKIGEPRIASSLVYNGLQPEEFEPVAPDPDAADFLYIGMMRDLKGPDLFIDALAQAEGLAGRNVTAVMIGDGDQLPDYHEQVKRLGLAGRVRFTPPMKARLAFARARAIVVPSRAEAMPYIVLEALAAGMPMIATEVGGIPEIFAGCQDALVKPDAAAIAKRMAQAIDDPAAFRRAMPTPADLKSKFGADVMTHDIETIYEASLPMKPAVGKT